MDKKSRTVRTPKAVLESEDMAIVSSFLKGLFSADGCFTHSGKHASCCLSVASVALRDDFVRLSFRLGFRFRSYSYSHSRGKNLVPLNLACIGRRNEVLRWMEVVGSISDGHNRRFSEWKNLIRNVFGVKPEV